MSVIEFTLEAFTATFVFPSNANKSLTLVNVVSLIVNVNASVAVAFINAAFRFAAVSAVTVAVTVPLVAPRIVFTLLALVVSVIVTFSSPRFA